MACIVFCSVNLLAIAWLQSLGAGAGVGSAFLPEKTTRFAQTIFPAEKHYPPLADHLRV